MGTVTPQTEEPIVHLDDLEQAGTLELDHPGEPHESHIHWGSPAMIGLYGLIVTAVVAPAFLLWCKHRLKRKGPKR